MPSDQQVNHLERAQSLVGKGGNQRQNGQEVEAELSASLSQAHASIAIAQELRELREQLEKGAIEVVYGGRSA